MEFDNEERLHLLFSADFATSRTMKADTRLKWQFALSIALLFIPVALNPQQATTFFPRQAAYGLTQNLPVCLSYEPSVVQLTGTIIRKTFPGPPNYESVERGDKPEVAWLLVLSQPICMEQDRKDPDLNPAQMDIRKIQLVFRDATAYQTQKELIGKKVLASGTLFGAHTGHHHTPILLTVNTLAKAS
jgi:hypothetical protein